MKIINKLLLSSILLSTSIFAQTTVCYKNDWKSPSTIENTPLDGGICEGKLTLNELKENGWKIADIKIDSNQNNLSYRYFLVKNDSNGILTDNTPITTFNSNKNFTINPIGTKITNIDGNKSTIDIGNLIVGESGIVVHIYENDKRLIVSNAKVISSNSQNSVIEFFPFEDLKQDAIPTSKRDVEINDILVLNYMYPSSLLIAPTQDTFQTVRANFKYNNFLHSDLFGANLKVNNNPYPSKKDIQKFAIEQNLGTVFIVADKKVNVLDTKTFEVLAQYNLDYANKDLQMPFYTRVEEIESSIFDISIPFISDKKIDNYEEYYKNILGLN